MQNRRHSEHNSEFPEGGKLKLKFLFCFILLFAYSIPFHTAVYAEPPKRIISLSPATTEILFTLGLGNNIAGVTFFCDHPAMARKIPKIGGMSNPSLERVVSLKPDIVVMTTDGNPKEFEERLRSLKIKTYVFKARRLAEFPQAVREMGAVLGVKENATAIAETIEAALGGMEMEKRNKSIPAPPKKKVLFVIWPEPLIVAGPGTAVDDTITLLGHENIASKVKTAYPKYSLEEIIHQSPDVIFIGKGHANMEAASASLLRKLKSVPAVRNNKVFYVSDSLYRLGPRVIQGIGELAAHLR
jgi:iron complex transport system substrate-binding protein